MTKDTPARKDFEARIASVALQTLERENKLPRGYLMDLWDTDSDWDFIVKLSLVLEALLTRAIVLEAGSSLAYDDVSRMRQSDRLKKARRLGLIDKAEWKMLASIATIRNHFVHRMENLLRPLSEYLGELEPVEQEKIAKSFLGTGIPAKLGEANDRSAIDRFSDSFRRTALHALFPTLLKLGYSHGIKQREKEHSEWRAEQERRLGRPLPPRKDFFLADRIMVSDLIAAETSIN